MRHFLSKLYILFNIRLSQIALFWTKYFSKSTIFPLSEKYYHILFWGNRKLMMYVVIHRLEWFTSSILTLLYRQWKTEDKIMNQQWLLQMSSFQNWNKFARFISWDKHVTNVTESLLYSDAALPDSEKEPGTWVG